MKITKARLKNIIREEMQRLEEAFTGPGAERMQSALSDMRSGDLGADQDWQFHDDNERLPDLSDLASGVDSGGGIQFTNYGPSMADQPDWVQRHAATYPQEPATPFNTADLFGRGPVGPRVRKFRQRPGGQGYQGYVDPVSPAVSDIIPPGPSTPAPQGMQDVRSGKATARRVHGEYSPSFAGGRTDYTIKRGDTLSQIAQDMGVDWRELARQSGIEPTDAAARQIQPGQELTYDPAMVDQEMTRPRHRGKSNLSEHRKALRRAIYAELKRTGVI